MREGEKEDIAFSHNVHSLWLRALASLRATCIPWPGGPTIYCH